MHWASVPQTKPMIKPVAAEKHKQADPSAAETTGDYSHSKIPRLRGTDSTDYVVGSVVWQREKGNNLLKKFRNYEI